MVSMWYTMFWLFRTIAWQNCRLRIGRLWEIYERTNKSSWILELISIIRKISTKTILYDYLSINETKRWINNKIWKNDHGKFHSKTLQAFRGQIQKKKNLIPLQHYYNAGFLQIIFCHSVFHNYVLSYLTHSWHSNLTFSWVLQLDLTKITKMNNSKLIF